MEGMIEMFSDEFHLHDWEKDKWDKIIRDREIEEGKQEGITIGKKEGITIGKKEGKQEGITIGKKEGIVGMIKNMLKENMDINSISRVSGESISEIKKIAKTM